MSRGMTLRRRAKQRGYASVEQMLDALIAKWNGNMRLVAIDLGVYPQTIYAALKREREKQQE